MCCRHEAIGVTTGRAFCGVVGHPDRHEYTGTSFFALVIYKRARILNKVMERCKASVL